MEENQKIENKINKKYIDYINMHLSLVVTVIMIIIIGTIIAIVVPNQLNVEYIKSNYIVSIENFVAEQSEKMQYIILTISFPIVYLCSYKLLQKLNIKTKRYKESYYLLLIIEIICILLILYFTMSKYYLIFGAITGSIFSLFLVKNKNFKNKYFFCGFYLIIIFIVSYLFINKTFEQNHYIAHHVDAYYYPILKISSGLTPYIDFNPLYGCYSYIFSLLEFIFKNNSLIFFSIINAILVAIVLFNITITTNKIIRNKVIAFLVVLSIIFSMVIHSFVISGGPYLQYMPHRTLFISCILLFITFYLKHRKSKNKILLQIIRLYNFCTCNILEF